MNVTKKQLQSALAFVSKDVTRFNLCGIAFEKVGENGRMIATDGHRLVVIDEGESLQDGSKEPAIILDGPALLTAAKTMGSKDVGVLNFHPNTDEGGSALLETPVGALCIPKIDGEYPDWRQIFPTGNTNAAPIALDPAYIADIGNAAKRLGIEQLVISFHGDLSPVLFDGGADELRFRAVLMPRRVN